MPLLHQGEGVILVIDRARDSQNASLAIFPETLRSDLHAIRATVEAFSKAGKLEAQKKPRRTASC